MTLVDPTEFPWGDRNPPGGYRVGDHVGLIYSDHEEYVFDNPTGIVIAVADDCMDADHPEPCGDCQTVTVQVEASIEADRVYLIKRQEENQ